MNLYEKYKAQNKKPSLKERMKGLEVVEEITDEDYKKAGCMRILIR